MFVGRYDYALDDKNRVRVPKKLRAGLSSNFILLKGTSRCIWIYSEETANDRLFSKIADLPISSKEAENIKRALFSSVLVPEEDAQGRFVLPKDMKDFAEISKQVVFVGVGDKIELWAQEKWEAYSKTVSIDDAIEGLKNYGL